MLKAGGVVHLASGVYNIEGSIKIHSNTVLTGESDTILRVSSSAGQWFVDGVGLIDNADTSLHDVSISGFQIDGNLKALPKSYANSGNGIHNAERAIDIRCDSGNFGSNISIHDLKIYDCYSDGIHVAFVNNVKVYNNFVSDCQHSGIYFISVVNGLMDSNKVASITSDGIRFDNCINNIFRNNILYSFSGDSNGAYKNGANFVQIANQSHSHGGGSDKPTSTKNIEGYGNIFSSGGLRDIWIDSTGKGVENVYVHDNTGTDIVTNGSPVTGIDFANISFSNPPTVEMSEKVFSNIFDILKMDYNFVYPDLQQDLNGKVQVLSYKNYSLIQVQGEDLTAVKVSYGASKVTHYLEKDIWIGSLSHQGNRVFLPGSFQTENLKVTCISGQGFQDVTNFEIIEKQEETGSINPDAVPFVGTLILFGIALFRNLGRLFK
ncbi:MAG TPA: right-handed parallel beta-helix repeat-containing protein [Clostridiaceae bacterium]